MFNKNDYKTGGPIRKPSARPSIHSYQSCPTTSNTMVSYGLSKNDRESDDSGNVQTVDEVDNMGKPAHAINLSPFKQINQKRNSLTIDNKLYTEDDDSDVLSKSVPATLPSYLHCSDNSHDENTPNNSHLSNLSHQSAGTPPDRSDRSHKYASAHHRLETSARTFDQNEQTQSNSWGLITVLAIIFLMLAVFLSNLNISYVSNESAYDEFKFYTDLSGLGEKYNVDENSILQVQTGISTIVQKEDTGSFMFVYNSNVNDFNAKEFNKFIHDVSFAASKYLRNHSTLLHYTTVEGSKLDMEDHSELIARYLEDLDKTGLMLVKHLEDIPSYLAMAFHYYCDEFNPLVRKSAIFFTLNLAKCPQESDKKNNSYHAIIEKCLAKKWSGVSMDNIGPLLTRVVNVVIDVTTQ